MNWVAEGNRFYQKMGFILLGLVLMGFGSAAIVRGNNPLTLPLLFHVHALTYLAWFGLFILQASLIGNGKRGLHKVLGMTSPILVIAMVISGWMMAMSSYNRGISPIPDISIQQFMAFPFFDLVGLVVFYGLALLNRANAEFHKRAMLLALVAIMDPATARMGIIIGIPPFPLLASLILVGSVMWHDRRVLQGIHVVTWIAFAWIFLRLGFVFGFGATDTWRNFATTLFS